MMKTQAVSILSRKNNTFPARLQVLADGRIINIDAVERCWTEMNSIHNSVAFIFRVRSGRQRFRLAENTMSGQCYLYSD